MVRTGSDQRNWKRIALVFMVATLILAVNSLGLVQGALSEATPMETQYQVNYEVYNYRTDRTLTLRYSVSSASYSQYKASTLDKLQIAAGNSQAYADLVQPDAPLVQAMARDLLKLSGGDEELYTNYALQIAHQMYYSLTPQAKSAVGTLIQSSGDCDPQAVAVASLIIAASKMREDFDADVVLFLYWPHKASPNEEVQWGHMQVGVHLQGGLDDARQSKMDEPAYYNYKGQRYYVAEPTYQRGFNPEWRQGWRLGENWYPRSPDVVIEL